MFYKEHLRFRQNEKPKEAKRAKKTKRQKGLCKGMRDVE
jgi:hypothetical protein